jgi:hypothetical protein
LHRALDAVTAVTGVTGGVAPPLFRYGGDASDAGDGEMQTCSNDARDEDEIERLAELAREVQAEWVSR